MSNKGMALVITLVYIMISAIVSVAVLAFSSQHYKTVSRRERRAEVLYHCEGGLYAGIDGERGNDDGNITVGTSTVNIDYVSESGTLESSANY